MAFLLERGRRRAETRESVEIRSHPLVCFSLEHLEGCRISKEGWPSKHCLCFLFWPDTLKCFPFKEIFRWNWALRSSIPAPVNTEGICVNSNVYYHCLAFVGILWKSWMRPSRVERCIGEQPWIVTPQNGSLLSKYFICLQGIHFIPQMRSLK